MNIRDPAIAARSDRPAPREPGESPDDLKENCGRSIVCLSRPISRPDTQLVKIESRPSRPVARRAAIFFNYGPVSAALELHLTELYLDWSASFHLHVHSDSEWLFSFGDLANNQSPVFRGGDQAEGSLKLATSLKAERALAKPT
jgi:hypothetical protein